MGSVLLLHWVASPQRELSGPWTEDTQMLGEMGWRATDCQGVASQGSVCLHGLRVLPHEAPSADHAPT